MPNLIQVKRGLEANVETLEEGEFGFTTDTYKIYIGNDVGLNQQIVMHHQLETVDGDTLEISWTPSYYIPKNIPIEARDPADLTAHLYGIDQMLYPISGLSGSVIMYDDSSGDFYMEATNGDIHLRPTVHVDSSGHIDSSGVIDSSGTPDVYEEGLIVRADGGVELYYNDAIKLQTTLAGVTMTGIMTMTAFAVTPSSAPTTNYQVANKKYVDDQIGGGGSGYAIYLREGESSGADVADSDTSDLYLEFDAGEFNLTAQSGNEVLVEIGDIDGGSF